ncbi:hypothetical protein SAMD00019534_116210 [Acytostelium subglobosum LB1]|uniref:hypothetical protein n=1 Tax=Acytostelium subglobosum LB1 TaxID=1410327 RepID=UPI000644FD47|nr:hypothetical protein SAMD00019534_116210 [Acytostelium subglobosum LB1]GAM28445.1 hypothetical protein SAMD00019534_116210 [Acytostelium subglobosum LB1]|eukprot:XP_012748484.1 hypothetical protein SAMD00019534_116210 [Acytostelium subglobosum LB1]
MKDYSNNNIKTDQQHVSMSPPKTPMYRSYYDISMAERNRTRTPLPPSPKLSSPLNYHAELDIDLRIQMDEQDRLDNYILLSPSEQLPSLSNNINNDQPRAFGVQCPSPPRTPMYSASDHQKNVQIYRSIFSTSTSKPTSTYNYPSSATKPKSKPNTMDYNYTSSINGDKENNVNSTNTPCPVKKTMKTPQHFTLGTSIYSPELASPELSSPPRTPFIKFNVDNDMQRQQQQQQHHQYPVRTPSRRLPDPPSHL